MKNKTFMLAIIATLLLSLQSCAVVGGIFKAGAATGIIAVVLFIALIIFILVKVFNKK